MMEAFVASAMMCIIASLVVIMAKMHEELVIENSRHD
jgi:hypothetical protein